MIKNTMRWILVIPSSLLGFGVALVVGLLVHSIVDSFCPTGWRVSGMCMWRPSWTGDLPVIFGAGLGAFLVVMFAALMAPTHKYYVAWILYGIGALYAAFTTAYGWQVVAAFGGANDTLKLSELISRAMPLISALAFGIFAVTLVRRRQRAPITTGASGGKAANDPYDL